MEVVISSSLWLSLVFPGSELLHDGMQQSQSQGDKSRDGLISISHVKMIGKSTGVMLLHDNVNFMPSMLDDSAWCQPVVLCKGVPLCELEVQALLPQPPEANQAYMHNNVQEAAQEGV